MNNTYLESQIPYLRALHTSLGLASSELADDLNRIEEAIKQAIDSRLKIRKDAVNELEEKIAKIKKRVGKMRAVLGEGEPEDLEAEAEASLPSRLGCLESTEARLKTIYTDRLMRIHAMEDQLKGILAILGKTYSLPPEIRANMQSTLGGEGGSLPPPYASKAVSVDQDLLAVDDYQDAGVTRVKALEEAIRLAHLAKMKKTEELTDLFEDLKFLHGELCLPLDQVEINRTTWIIPDSIPLELSSSFLPIVTSFIVPESTKSLVGVDPTEDLLNFCGTLQGAWLAEKSKREAEIQTLFDEVEPIWLRLQVSQEEIQSFIEEHCGLSTDTIAAYQVELERVKILRRESLGGFIQAIRQEIQGLWDRLLYGPRTMEGFAAFYEESLSEALLAEHEIEAGRLAEELESKGLLLSKAQEWVDLKAKEEELEAKRNGPDRFNTRGGALLQEEKMRKRIGALKPKLEAELLHLVPAWEEENGIQFLVDDIRIVDVILLEQEVKDAEREAKKRTKIMGGSATPARHPRAPTSMSTHRTPMASRAREPPTPTPFQGGHRVARGLNPLASSTSSIPSSNSLSRGVNPLACSTSSISGPGRTSAVTRAQPPPAYNLPRPGTARVHTMPQARPLSSSGAHNITQARSATHGSMTSGIPKISGNTAALLSRDGARRPRRESFKPRRSVVGRVDTIRTHDQKSWTLEDFVEEF